MNMMPQFIPGSDFSSNGEQNFQKCLVYIQKTFPDEPELTQMKMAQAVFSISEVFFNEILPKVLSNTLRPSMN